MKALFDTNILIDFLNGVELARDEIGRYEERAISLVSWMEVMVGAETETEAPVRDFLGSFTLAPLSNAVAERAVLVRRRTGIKLPDAIVWATADIGSMLLVTRNTRDFSPDTPGIRVPYRL